MSLGTIMFGISEGSESEIPIVIAPEYYELLFCLMAYYYNWIPDPSLSAFLGLDSESIDGSETIQWHSILRSFVCEATHNACLGRQTVIIDAKLLWTPLRNVSVMLMTRIRGAYSREHCTVERGDLVCLSHLRRKERGWKPLIT